MAADPLGDALVASQSSRANDGIKIQGIPLGTVARKSAYLLAIVVGCVIAEVVTHKLLGLSFFRASGLSASAYGLVVGMAQLFVAVPFLVWLRHVRRSEGVCGRIVSRLDLRRYFGGNGCAPLACALALA
jgi:hypothetical protein